MTTWRVIRGDCLELLPTMAADSLDACVTDPPYGIGFMGKEWDTFKPHAHPQPDRLVKRAPIVSDNPNINGRHRSPAISESQIAYDMTLMGTHRFQDWTKRWAGQVLRVLKPGAYLVVCGAPRSYHRMACGIEDAGFEIRDCLCWLFGQGFPKSLNLGDGRGTALKPAHEPIVIARKPFKGSVAANVAQYGTGALNIDACRIDYDGKSLDDVHREAGSPGRGPGRHSERVYQPMHGDPDRQVAFHDLGRWPANVVLDDCAAEVLDQMSGELESNSGELEPLRARSGDVFGARFRMRSGHGRTDAGGASRFYYVAKPSREERDFGIYDLDPRQRDESRKPGNPGGDNPRNRGLQRRGNFHPTVKPVALMRWLVRLVTPPDGTVLDPFTGSGTTGMACRYEQRGFVGIEREAEYVALAERRIDQVAPLFSEHSA